MYPSPTERYPAEKGHEGLWVNWEKYHHIEIAMTMLSASSVQVNVTNSYANRVRTKSRTRCGTAGRKSVAVIYKKLWLPFLSPPAGRLAKSEHILLCFILVLVSVPSLPLLFPLANLSHP